MLILSGTGHVTSKDIRKQVLCQKIVQARSAGPLWILPLSEFHLLGGSSVGHVEELAGFSVAVFLFLPFPAARSDLNMNSWDSVPFLQHSIRPLFLLTKSIGYYALMCVYSSGREGGCSSSTLGPKSKECTQTHNAPPSPSFLDSSFAGTIPPVLLAFLEM